MPLTEDQAADIAIELNEAIPAAITFAKLPTADKALVIQQFVDGLIGTDESALIKSIPGLTPEITEVVTDSFIRILGGALAKYWDEPRVEV